MQPPHPPTLTLKRKKTKKKGFADTGLYACMHVCKYYISLYIYIYPRLYEKFTTLPTAAAANFTTAPYCGAHPRSVLLPSAMLKCVRSVGHANQVRGQDPKLRALLPSTKLEASVFSTCLFPAAPLELIFNWLITLTADNWLIIFAANSCSKSPSFCLLMCTIAGVFVCFPQIPSV